MKKRLLSGVTATGNLTIGNYLGAIKNFVACQATYEMYIFVADLHALTIDISREELQTNRHNLFALYLACGLDPTKTTLFFQSDVVEHSQLNWVMESMATLGELKRMTQFKEKVLQAKQTNGTTKIKIALLTYPTLMASDILLYNADKVLGGQDQKQHVELTKNLAQRFNNCYGPMFKIPEFITEEVTTKIMALQNPRQKMSKSDANPKNSIFLLEDPEQAVRKIKKAVTDSEGRIYIDEQKPAIKNLLAIYAGLNNLPLTAAAAHFQDKNYGQLKEELAMAVKSLLETIQAKYHMYLKDVDKYAAGGAHQAGMIAKKTIAQVYKKVGLDE